LVNVLHLEDTEHTKIVALMRHSSSIWSCAFLYDSIEGNAYILGHCCDSVYLSSILHVYMFILGFRSSILACFFLSLSHLKRRCHLCGKRKNVTTFRTPNAFLYRIEGGIKTVCVCVYVWLLIDFHVTSYSTQNFSHAMDFLEGREHGKEIQSILIV
jgi:hypothetical protein